MEYFNQLKEAVTHHVNEEESNIFQKAKEVFSEEEAEALALAMEDMKQEMANFSHVPPPGRNKGEGGWKSI